MEIQVSSSYTLSYPELHFPDGITVITGPSGVGKTTLLRALHGDFNSELAVIHSEQKTALMPQQQQWISYMTMNEQLTMTVGKLWESVAIKLGLQDHFEKLPAELSVGQQQRFWLAWVLAEDAHWLLFDEPTSALDDDWATSTIQLFEQYKIDYPRKKLVIVTHDVRLLQANIQDHLIAL
ncbi:ATP-binding cassette domain-containing protein [Schleiferiaceae bacterium]|nr:ATP-binding cassette domain-containing protein [Schleiferiaceae bacterium]